MHTNGFALAKAFQENGSSAHIVFISQNAQFIHSSMLLQPFYFIRKTHLDNDLKNFSILVKRQIKKDNIIFLQYNYVKTHVKIENIIFIESKQHVLYIHCRDSLYKDNRSLKDILHILEPYDFVQVHKSYIIHFSYLISYSKNVVTLIQNQDIHVSRKYKENFEYQYKEYLLK